MGASITRAAERRGRVLVFTSPELTSRRVTAPIVMKLFASTTAKDTDWTGEADRRPSERLRAEHPGRHHPGAVS